MDHPGGAAFRLRRHRPAEPGGDGVRLPGGADPGEAARLPREPRPQGPGGRGRGRGAGVPAPGGLRRAVFSPPEKRAGPGGISPLPPPGERERPCWPPGRPGPGRPGPRGCAWCRARREREPTPFTKAWGTRGTSSSGTSKRPCKPGAGSPAPVYAFPTKSLPCLPEMCSGVSSSTQRGPSPAGWPPPGGRGCSGGRTSGPGLRWRPASLCRPPAPAACRRR